MPNLNNQEMIVVAETFNESLDFVLGNYPKEIRDELYMFIVEIIMLEKPYMLVGVEGLPYISKKVFTNEHIRDLLFTLQFTFISRCGLTDIEYGKLVENIAQGLKLVSHGSVSAMPKPISDRLSQFTDILEVLMSNSWLVMIMLIKLFVSSNSAQTTKPVDRKNPPSKP